MALTIGKMDRRVVMQGNNPTVTATGGQVDGDFSTYANTRGYLRRKSGNKAIVFGDIALNNSWELYVRFQINIQQNLRADNKIIIDISRVFKVEGFELIEEDRMYYRIDLTEQTK